MRHHAGWKEVLASLAMLLTATQAAAQPHALKAPVEPSKCTPTAKLATRNYPGEEVIPTINYLPLPAGKAVEAPGQKILITAQVLDRNCVPASGAVVEIWQNDPFGRWILSNAEDLVDARPVFNGAGRTATDNQGVFHFITLFPAATGGLAPNFNVRIVAPGMAPFTTALYFANDRHNTDDKRFMKLSAAEQRSVMLKIDDSNPDLLGGSIVLVLPGNLAYRGY